MAKAAVREHPILRKLSKICVSLPEAARRDLNEHADFRVRGKDGEALDWSEVRNLVELSYGLVAPKRLLPKK
jgi:hypothetical protein